MINWIETHIPLHVLQIALWMWVGMMMFGILYLLQRVVVKQLHRSKRRRMLREKIAQYSNEDYLHTRILISAEDEQAGQ